MKNLFFFGDSLTLGVNDNEQPGGWVSRLTHKALAKGLLQGPPAMADTVYNLGVRRHSTHDIAARWKAETRCRMLVGGEPYLIFCTGVVDMAAPQGKVNVPLPEALQECRALLQAACLESGRVLLISAPPVRNAEHCQRLGQWNTELKSLCASLHVPFVDVYADMLAAQDYMQALSDGLHPGPRGCECFAEALWAAPALQSFLQA